MRCTTSYAETRKGILTGYTNAYVHSMDTPLVPGYMDEPMAAPPPLKSDQSNNQRVSRSSASPPADQRLPRPGRGKCPLLPFPSQDSLSHSYSLWHNCTQTLE
eukprot:4808652-Pleurochrysis_carterae.AAC.1